MQQMVQALGPVNPPAAGNANPPVAPVPNAAAVNLPIGPFINPVAVNVNLQWPPANVLAAPPQAIPPPNQPNPAALNPPAAPNVAVPNAPAANPPAGNVPLLNGAALFNQLFAGAGFGPLWANAPQPAADDPAPERPRWESAGLLRAPRLTTLSILSLAFNLFELPLQWSQVIDLTLDKEGLPGLSGIASRDVLKLLELCPELLSLRVTVQDTAAPAPFDERDGRVLHDKLEALHLMAYSQQGGLFGQPNLNQNIQLPQTPFRLIGPRIHLPRLHTLLLTDNSRGADLTPEFFAQSFVTLAPVLHTVQANVWMFTEAELVEFMRNLPPTVRVLTFPTGRAGVFETGPLGEPLLGSLMANEPESVIALPDLETFEIHARVGFSESSLLRFIEQRIPRLKRVVVNFQKHARLHNHHGQANPAPQAPLPKKKLAPEERARMNALIKGDVKGLKVELKYPDKQIRIPMSPWTGLAGHEVGRLELQDYEDEDF